MNAQIYRRVELVFWRLFINIMTENKRVQSAFKHGYHILYEVGLFSIIKTMAFASLVGFIAGFIFYCLAIYIK
jgi:hypothetical protein